MHGGNHHGVLSNPDKMTSVKHLQGNISNYFILADIMRTKLKVDNATY